jgi:hypothetical protein
VFACRAWASFALLMQPSQPGADLAAGIARGCRQVDQVLFLGVELRYRINPRLAFRLVHGWSQREVVDPRAQGKSWVEIAAVFRR